MLRAWDDHWDVNSPVPDIDSPSTKNLSARYGIAIFNRTMTSAGVQRRFPIGLTDPWWNVCVSCWQFKPEKRPQINNVRRELRVGMTPQGAEHPTRAIDRLSTNLWLAILSYASALPWALDPMLLESSPLRQWDSLHFPVAQMVEFYTVSQRTKLSLALVSHRLKAIALPELYRYIWLHKCAQARRLAETLGAHWDRGSWLRRLNVDCLAGRSGAAGAMQASALDVHRILDTCTDLVVLLDRRGMDVTNHTPRWPPMLAPHAPALRRCALSHYGERARLGGMLDVVAGMGACLEVTPSVDLPKLHTLELTLSAEKACAPLLALMTRWKLPALKTMRLLGTFATSSELRAFVNAHGANVELLELGSADLPPHIFSSQPAPRPPWILTPESLPELQTLIVTASRNYRIPHPLLPAHPCVTVLGVRELERRVRETHPQCVLEQLGDCMPKAERFAALREIHSLTYGESPTARKTRDAQVLVLQLFWRRFVQLAHESGDVAVCDPWGRPVVLPAGERDRVWGIPARLAPL
ncbi:hypothetical protein AURDEDRAFT_164993 [Auricularia subglabra TFB-10046 SS5]|nr:hypothetical protein AURDEDRAFT_164993 [Auricularia subglabra TFB-10046 SS5]